VEDGGGVDGEVGVVDGLNICFVFGKLEEV
jgi:hypothetical protein